MARLGYARVSLADQDTDLQIQELEAAGCERIYKDQGISGTRVSRPELDRMLDRLGSGDEVVVWKLDRLGRNTRHLLELLDDFKMRGVKFRSLRDGISTDPASEVGGAMAQAIVTIISAFAQLERDQLSERIRAGMAAAAANGRRAGRREVTASHAKVKRAHELKAHGLRPTDIGKIIGASRATVYRYLSMVSVLEVGCTDVRSCLHGRRMGIPNGLLERPESRKLTDACSHPSQEHRSMIPRRLLLRGVRQFRSGADALGGWVR